MEQFKRYLYQFKCEKGQTYTHTSIANPKISLFVPPEKAVEFNEAYNKAMVTGCSLHLTEKPTDPSPMRVDLDYRFMIDDTKEVKRRYTLDDNRRIVKTYFTILLSYLNAPDDAWIAYVMEKPQPVESRGKIKDGIHLVFPHLIVSHKFQHLVRKKVLDVAQEMFANMSLCNTYENIIDDQIIDKNNWQMYGSHKPDCDAYRVTRVFSYNVATQDIDELPTPTAEEELKFVKLFSMRHQNVDGVLMKPEKEAEIDEYFRLVLPAMDERKKEKLHSQVFGKSINYTRNYISDEDLNLARQLVAECLSQTRAVNYNDWIKVGWTLRNIDYRLLDSWVDFSKCSSKYIEGECNRIWDMMRIDTLGMGTLRWWASLDNPDKYREILDQNAITLIDRCIGSDGAHFDVAKVVHALYKDRYRFTSKDIWYMFKEEKHRWVRTREGLQLRLVLSNEVCSKFMDRALYWNTQANRVQENRDIIEEKAKKLTSIALRLKQTGYKDSLMKECKCLFTDEKFEELLDSHPHLVGFENGVYDLRMHEFRDGLPDDYISFTTSRHYFPFDNTCAEYQEIQRFLSSVYTNENVRKYMVDILACILDGGIRQEKFYILTGSGCHAKGSQIRMYDGSVKAIEEVCVGEKLMGDDSRPRLVERLWRGRSDMYTIKPIFGEPFVVNGSHKLTLRITSHGNPHITCNNNDGTTSWCVNWMKHVSHSDEDGDVITWCSRLFADVALAEGFLLRHQRTMIKENDIFDIQVQYLKDAPASLMSAFGLFRTRVDYPTRECVNDPYTLGYEVRSEIPAYLKINDRKTRLAVLAGVLDSRGGGGYDLTLHSETLIDDVIELARSLGFTAFKTTQGAEYHTCICNGDLNEIPCNTTNVPQTDHGDTCTLSFKIDKMCDDEEYYGVQVDQNHRYLMSDYMVTANSNGKSRLLELVQKAIGDYFCILPIALLTQKRAASNSAQGELERTKGRRFAVMQEPGENERLNIGLMKELSGGDRIMVRGLYKEPIEFKPQFKMAMTCNELPEVPSDDGGTWRRIKVIEHTSKFVERPNPKIDKEFMMDPELVDKFDRWADTFASMLVYHHSTIDPRNIHEPLDVRAATDKYKKNNDMIGQYISEKMEADEDSTEKVLLNKVYNDFKAWAYSVVQKGKKVPDRNQFRTYMEKQFGAYPSDGKGWRGIRYLNAGNNDDVE